MVVDVVGATLIDVVVDVVGATVIDVVAVVVVPTVLATTLVLVGALGAVIDVVVSADASIVTGEAGSALSLLQAEQDNTRKDNTTHDRTIG